MYTVDFDEATETYTSVEKAYKAIEQYWQCGNAQSLADVKRTIKVCGMARVSLSIAPESHYFYIDKA